MGMRANTIDSKLIEQFPGGSDGRVTSRMLAELVKKQGNESSMMKKSMYGKQNAVVETNPYQSGQQDNLEYTDVKRMADENNVSCKAIYELHAEFSSMIKIYEHEQLTNVA